MPTFINSSRLQSSIFFYFGQACCRRLYRSISQDQFTSPRERQSACRPVLASAENTLKSSPSLSLTHSHPQQFRCPVPIFTIAHFARFSWRRARALRSLISFFLFLSSRRACFLAFVLGLLMSILRSYRAFLVVDGWIVSVASIMYGILNSQFFFSSRISILFFMPIDERQLKISIIRRMYIHWQMCREKREQSTCAINVY